MTIDDEEPVVVSSRQYMLNVSKIIYGTPKRLVRFYYGSDPFLLSVLLWLPFILFL